MNNLEIIVDSGQFVTAKCGNVLATKGRSRFAFYITDNEGTPVYVDNYNLKDFETILQWCKEGK